MDRTNGLRGGDVRGAPTQRARREWWDWIACLSAISLVASAAASARSRALVTASSVVTGTGAGLVPLVSIFDGATAKRTGSLLPFGRELQSGARVAVGDVNGDGVPDIVAAAGPGTAPIVNVIDGVHGTAIAQFLAYEPGFRGGVFVAAGDVNGDGFADIVTGAGETALPHVKVFNGVSLPSVLNSFLAYSPQFTGGVRVAAGDINRDGLADIITSPGAGGPPLVNVFSGGTLQVLASFFAYAPQFTDGVFVASGDVDGDQAAEIVTGAGASTGGLPVKVFSVSEVGVQIRTSFFAYAPDTADGVTVAAGDVDGDDIADVVTGTERGAPHVKVFDGRDGTARLSFFATTPRIGNGVFVAGLAPPPLHR